MDIPVRINAEVDSLGLIEALVSSPINLIGFVLELDREVSDEGFSLRLVEKLCQSLHDEYESILVTYTERMLVNTFGEETTNSSLQRMAYNFPTQSDIDCMTERQESMAAVLKLLHKISNGL